MPDTVIHHRSELSVRLFARWEHLNPDQSALLKAMSRDMSVRYVRLVARMILGWRRPSPLSCPLHHIHGARDRLIPLGRQRPDDVIPDGGHLINLTHADRVNSFIRNVLATSV